ncbi:nitroreductase family protein [Streptomyces sp. JJ36]|nr:nitroreductase family protein [Streptomyces sp. JJ36]
MARLLADAAAAAPSLHNAQPWRFRHHRGSGVFEVHADFSRAVPEADPDQRELHLGCGAAVMNLRVAAAHHGLAAATRLLPDPTEPGLVAAVRLRAAGEEDGEGVVEQDLVPLFPAVHERHTSRYPFAEAPLPERVRAALTGAAAREGVSLSFPSPWHLEWVLELTEEAEARTRADADREAELARWTRLGAAEADTAADGVPEYAFGPRRRGGRAPVREFGEDRRTADLGSVPFEEHPQLALLTTPEDRREDWLRAGQAVQRVLLLATREDVAASFMTGVLEWSETRWPLRDPASSEGFVQMVLRLGYGPRGPKTPRRPSGEVLDILP